MATAGVAVAVDLHGSFQIAQGAAPTPVQPRRTPFYWEEWNGFLPPAARRLDPPRDLAFALIGPPPATPEEPRRTIELVDGALRPAAVIVRPGTTVRFENHDEFIHELYAVDFPAFAPEQTSPNAARVVQLREARIYEIRDRRVPHVRGWIAVTPIAYSGNPGPDGAILLTGVPAGSYTLKVLFDGRWIHEQPLEVTEGGREGVTIPPIRVEPAPAAPSAGAPAPTPTAPAAGAH